MISWLLLAAVAFSSALWCWALLQTVLTRRRVGRLGAVAPRRADWPTFSLICPARDEEAVVGQAIRSALAADYPRAEAAAAR